MCSNRCSAMRNEARSSNKFHEMTPRKCLLLLKAATGLLAFFILLRIRPTHTLRRFLSECEPGTKNTTAGDLEGWAVGTMARRLPGTTCLTRALTTMWLLEGSKIPAKLQIGVEPHSDVGFRAHAWVECQGKIVIGKLPHLGSYIPLDGGNITSRQFGTAST